MQSLKTITKRIIPFNEVVLHNKTDDCWTVVNGYVYDITKILKTHSGGFSKIFQAAGKDASKIFSKSNNNI